MPFEEGTPTTPADAISSFTGSNYYQYDTPPDLRWAGGGLLQRGDH